MKRFSLHSLRVRLASLILMIMVLVSGIMLGTYLKERSFILSQVSEDFIRVVTLIAGDQEELIGRTRQFLFTLAQTPAVRDIDTESCSGFLAHLIDEYPRTIDLGVVDTKGNLVCSASPVTSSVDFSSENWFKHSTISSDFAMATLRAGSQKGTDFAISYPLLDREGSVLGVIYATVDLTRFSQFLSHLHPARQIEFMMIGDDGSILNCYSGVEDCPGKTRVKESLLKAVLGMGKGTVDMRDSDGVERLYAFAPLSGTVDTGVYVTIGVPASSLYSNANRVLAYQFAGLWGVTLLALWSVWFGGNALIITPLKTMVETSQHLSLGKLEARTGLPHRRGELGCLARALDTMAETLENRANQVERYEQQLRSLASQLSGAEDRERRRLAADLHDRLGQLLAISKIKLGMLLQMETASESKTLIAEIRSYIGQAVLETRSLTFEISPPILYELGLEAALEYLTEQVQNQHGLTVAYSDDRRSKPLDDDIRALFYRSAGELLHNVIKHAGAGRATMSTRRDGERFVLSVEDDGIGLQIGVNGLTSGNREGFGLFSIRERLRHVGGRFIIESHPGHGTRVVLMAPLKREEVEIV